jgi:hypothetical protein
VPISQWSAIKTSDRAQASKIRASRQRADNTRPGEPVTLCFRTLGYKQLPIILRSAETISRIPAASLRHGLAQKDFDLPCQRGLQRFRWIKTDVE